MASSCVEQQGEAQWRQGEPSNLVAQQRRRQARHCGGAASRAALRPSDDDVEACRRARPCVLELLREASELEPRRESSELEVSSPFSPCFIIFLVTAVDLWSISS
nr:unnamed protein product [Digitaria exilis]